MPILDASRVSFGSAICHDPLPIGGVAVALLSGTFALLDLPVDLPLMGAGFCGGALVYLVDRVWIPTPGDRINHPERMAWVRAHWEWLAGETALLSAGAGAMVFYLEWTTLLGTAVLGGVASLHVLGPARGFLQWGGVHKPLAIAGAWAVGATVLPVLESGGTFGIGTALFCVYRLLFIVPNVMMADWSDRAGDAAAGLAPWAARWSEAHVRWSASVMLLIALGGALGWAWTAEAPVLIGIDAVGPVLMLGVVWELNLTRPLHAFLADMVVGWPLIPALLDWMIV